MLILGGAAGIYWHYSKSRAKVQWELEAASRRAEQIADEGRRRILGLKPNPYPTAKEPSAAIPVTSIGLGVAGLAVAISLGGAASPSAAPSAAQSRPVAVEAVTTNKKTDLMVRSAPDTSSDVIDTLAPRSHITVLCWDVGELVYRGTAENDHWHRLNDPEPQWISGAYVKVLGSEAHC